MGYLYGKTGSTEPYPFTDMLGLEVKLGDVVAYATGRGANATLKVGSVVELNWVQKMDGGWWDFKVWANLESNWRDRNGPAVPTDATRASEPSRGRMVRVAKGDGWK